MLFRSLRLNLADLQAKSVDELRELAAEHDIENHEELEHSDLVLKLLDVVPLAPTQPRDRNGQPAVAEGILEIVDEGFGFLRVNGVMPSPQDIYVSTSQVRRFGLRTGDRVAGQTRQPKDQEKYWGLLRVDSVNGVEPTTAVFGASDESTGALGPPPPLSGGGGGTISTPTT